MSGSWINRARRHAIYSRDSFCCQYCGTDESALEGHNILTLDHVVARESGGSNASDNLITSCRSCNSSKEARSMRTFYIILRARGIDTRAVSRRIHSQRRKPIDLDTGHTIIAARKAA